MEDRAGIPRFFVPDLPASVGTLAEGDGAVQAAPPRVFLPPGESHHAAHVLRLTAGATVELFDGRGARARGRVVDVARREVCVAVDAVERTGARPGPRVHLAFATPKGNRLDWLLEKATELGAASLRPVTFERSVAGAAKPTPARRDRWLGHCIAAAKQAGLDFLPDLGDPVPLAALLDRPSDALWIVGDLGDGAVPFADALSRRAPRQDILILVGPEGGLTGAERDRVVAAGFTPVRIGRTTLRIETAAVALLAAAMAMCD